MTLTRTLAELAIDTPLSRVTPSAWEAAKRMTLDTLATAMAGAKEPGVRELVEQLRDWGGRPDGTVLVWGDRLPLPHAVCANSAMAHAWDYDDIHPPSALHIMCMMLPACLAVAETRRLDGRTMLGAIVLGVEAAGRLGLAYNRRRSGPQGQGFLPTSVAGSFGVTAAACRLIGLNVDQTVHALGLNYAQAAGNRQGLFDAVLTKRLQPALAARSAIWAASLAERGVTGPPRAMEGAAGLFRVYLSAEPPDADELMSERGIWEIERDGIKRYTSCGASHPVTHAALALVREHDLSPRRIERVELYFGPNGNNLVGNPFRFGDNPQVNAQFSAPYAVALAVVRRTGDLPHFTDRKIREDAEVAEFARQRVHIVHEMDPEPEPIEVPEDYPANTARPDVVRLVLTNGRVLRREMTAYELFRPGAVSLSEVEAKYRGCAAFAGHGHEAGADQLLAAVRRLDEASGVEDLLEHLTPAEMVAGSADDGNA